VASLSRRPRPITYGFLGHPVVGLALSELDHDDCLSLDEILYASAAVSDDREAKCDRWVDRSDGCGERALGTAKIRLSRSSCCPGVAP
jgi:hypothetical protein